jgi:hypothetical protein
MNRQLTARWTIAGGRKVWTLALSVMLGCLGLVPVSSASSARATVSVKVTTRSIHVTGTAPEGAVVLQINFDPHRCASFHIEQNRRTRFVDFHPAAVGSFGFTVTRASVAAGGGAPRYACAYMLVLSGPRMATVLASATARLS